MQSYSDLILVISHGASLRRKIILKWYGFYAPVLKWRVRGKSLPWITHDIKDLMRQRDYHHRKAINKNEECHWSSYRKLRNTVTAKLWKGKEDYSRTQLIGKTEIKKDMWKSINELLSKNKLYNTNGCALTATKFCHIFQRLQQIWVKFSDQKPWQCLVSCQQEYRITL